MSKIKLNATNISLIESIALFGPAINSIAACTIFNSGAPRLQRRLDQSAFPLNYPKILAQVRSSHKLNKPEKEILAKLLDLIMRLDVGYIVEQTNYFIAQATQHSKNGATFKLISRSKTNPGSNYKLEHTSGSIPSIEISVLKNNGGLEYKLLYSKERDSFTIYLDSRNEEHTELINSVTKLIPSNPEAATEEPSSTTTKVTKKNKPTGKNPSEENIIKNFNPEASITKTDSDDGQIMTFSIGNITQLPYLEIKVEKSGEATQLTFVHVSSEGNTTEKTFDSNDQGQKRKIDSIRLAIKKRFDRELFQKAVIDETAVENFIKFPEERE